jgi:hypothetical protein
MIIVVDSYNRASGGLSRTPLFLRFVVAGIVDRQKIFIVDIACHVILVKYRAVEAVYLRVALKRAFH